MTPVSALFAKSIKPHRVLSDGLIVLLLVVLWLAGTAWMRPLMLPDEGRYAGVAWEMLRSGQWLTPTLNGLPFFHKPPLFYWITASSLALFGPVELAARAGSLVGATLAAMALYLFTRRWSDQQAARRALWVLLVQPLFFIGGQFANLDMLVAGCITATILALAHAALCHAQGGLYRRPLWGAYALAALGVLAKGLIGFVLPAMVVGLWLLLQKRWRTLWALCSLSGVGLFLCITAPWFWAMEIRFEGFLHYFFVVQHFQRFSGSGFNNVMPMWFYPAVLLLCSAPCIVWTRPLWRRAYFAQATSPQDTCIPTSISVSTAGLMKAPPGQVRLLMVLAVGCVLLFFSIPRSKLVGYILPTVAPLAWLMADASVSLTTTAGRQRAWQICLASSAAIGAAVVVVLAMHSGHSLRSLGQTLAQERTPAQPVLMLQQYYYDVPFYAHLRDPVLIIDDWAAPDVAARDNWRKEVADAGAFHPALAQQVLLQPQALPAVLCAQPTAWIVAEQTSALQHYPFLAHFSVVALHSGVALWRVQRQALTPQLCPEKPSGDSTYK